MKAKLLTISAALVFLLLSARSGPAQAQAEADPDWLRSMLEQGWQEVQTGVLERRPGGNRLETYTYGEAGRRYAVQRLEERIRALEQEQSGHPSENVAQVLQSLKGELRRELKRLEAMVSAAKDDSLVRASTAATCTASFEAHAATGPLGGAVGVTASANASYSSGCGEPGNVYSYAYVRAVEQNKTNIQSQEEAISQGTSLTSQATASLGGSQDCYAEAWAQSFNLNETYTMGDAIYGCTSLGLQVIVPVGAGWADGNFFSMEEAFDGQPTLNTAGEPVGGGGNDAPYYADRVGYIDFGPNWDKVRITSTWTQYRQWSLGDQTPYSQIWWDDDIDLVNDSGLNEYWVNFNTAQNLDTAGTEPWLRDRDFPVSPVIPKARYLLCRTPSNMTGRAREYAFVGYIVP